MKVCISFQPHEQTDADAVFAAVKGVLPRSKVHKTDNKPPYIRLFLTTKKPANPHEHRDCD